MNKRRVIISLFVLLLISPLEIFADGYDALWKQIQEARRKDLPRTEIAALDKIITKAKAEKEYGILLAAELQQAQAWQSISPDSLKPRVDAMTAKAQKLEKSNSVLSSVYYAVLAHIYQTNQKLFSHSDDTLFCSKALANPDLLARQKAKAYKPLVSEAIDSRIFNNDLLHVIGMDQKAYQFLHDYYAKQGNRQAACVMAALMMQQRIPDTRNAQKSKYLHSIDSLINEYQDLAECGRLAVLRYRYMSQSSDSFTAKERYEYIQQATSKWSTYVGINELRNEMLSMTCPTFSINSQRNLVRPSEDAKIYVDEMRNLRQLTLHIYRTKLNGASRVALNVDSQLAALKKASTLLTARTITRNYPERPPYESVKDSFQLGQLPVGIYLIEAQSDNKSIKPSYSLLYVSDVARLIIGLPDKKQRMVVVNATSGQPLPGAKIAIYKMDYRNPNALIKTLTCDKNGEATVSGYESWKYAFFAYTADDNFAPITNTSGNFYYEEPDEHVQQIRVYTDRSLYRPGQKVHAATIIYDVWNGTDTRASSNTKVTFTLKDANYQDVKKFTATTDEFGSASAEFTLPSSGLTGRYSVTVDTEEDDSEVSFHVEEYKRPTFDVSIPEVTEAYKAGDTITVKGVAKTFSGVAVQGAKVTYEVRRQPSWWWWYRMSGDHEASIAQDTVVTAADGSFLMRVPLTVPHNADTERYPRFYNFNITAHVVDATGESQTAEISLPLGTKATALSFDLPERIEKDSLRQITFRYVNAANKPIDGTVSYTVGGKSFTVPANKLVDISWPKSMPSGRYTVEAICGTDTLKRTVALFSIDDKTPIAGEKDWKYQSSATFPADGSAVYVQVGADDPDVYVVYSVFSGNNIIREGHERLNHKLLNDAFSYKPEYGYGLSVNYCWVKDGVVHKFNSTISCPLPDKRLNVKWTSFRDRLTPGQKEEWTLNISRPDGKSAKAQLMSVLYDKSLDKIYPHSWDYKTLMTQSLSYTRWISSMDYLSGITLYGALAQKSFPVKSYNFSTFSNDYFPYGEYFAPGRRNMLTGAVARGKSAMLMMAKQESASMDMAAAPMMNEYAAPQEVVVAGYNEKVPSLTNENSTSGSFSVRENLNETAFFYPALVTDAKGNIALRFTLPESVTTWRFIGLAHDADMRYGFLNGEAVASKELMVQPNVPRFIRLGDSGVLQGRVSNTSKKDITGQATMQLLDPVSEKVVYEQQQNITLKAGESRSVGFTADFSDGSELYKRGEGVLICRMMVSAGDMTDGEQHYLPILSDKELMTRSSAFTLDGAGEKRIDLTKLFPTTGSDGKLTIEYTNHPEWLMIETLPTVSHPYKNDAISQATALYSNTIAKTIIQSAPAIKRVIDIWRQETGSETTLESQLRKDESLHQMVLSETPWVMDANKQTESRQKLIDYFDENNINSRLDAQLSRLKDLQRLDGSWSWWPGMQGSTYITAEVARLLVRLNHIAGKQSNTRNMIVNAFQFLDKKMNEEVINLKKLQAKGYKNLRPSETMVDYLYTRALDESVAANKIGTWSSVALANRNYLVKLLSQQTQNFTLFGKAQSAVVLARYGYKSQAKTYLQSLDEYAVSTPEMGRYYDSRKAYYSWQDYRIPTQVAAIEAFQLLRPDATSIITEMKRWLLQEKRTTEWDTPVNCVNAVYAFLSNQQGTAIDAQKLATETSQPVITLDGATLSQPKASAALGYQRQSESVSHPRELTITKTDAGTSWGAAYAQYLQRATDAEASSQGITVRRELLDEAGNAIAEGTRLTVGQKVTVRITLTAQRDYDFVEVIDRRAACLEPASQISGYHWEPARQYGSYGLGYYIAPRDNQTSYYFDQLSKGAHVVTTAYYVDREGEYRQGSCVAECAYAPEYRGSDKALVISASAEAK